MPDDSNTVPIRRDRDWLRAVRIGLKLILIPWAGFWTWFVLMGAIDSGWAAAPYAARILVPLLGLTVACWFWPRVSGFLLILAGIFAWSYFHHGFTQMTLAAPAIVVGLLLAALPARVGEARLRSEP